MTEATAQNDAVSRAMSSGNASAARTRAGSAASQRTGRLGSRASASASTVYSVDVGLHSARYSALPTEYAPPHREKRVVALVKIPTPSGEVIVEATYEDNTG